MRGFDYVGKRVLFAALTVFVAITLNFVLFRTLSGDAVSALRCRQCTRSSRSTSASSWGSTSRSWEQYKLYLRGPRPREHGEVAALRAAGHP